LRQLLVARFTQIEGMPSPTAVAKLKHLSSFDLIEAANKCKRRLTCDDRTSRFAVGNCDIPTSKPSPGRRSAEHSTIDTEPRFT
jgi:hypothetical protein